jgi:hypothetical protein
MTFILIFLSPLRWALTTAKEIDFLSSNLVKGTPLRFDVALYIRGSPGKEASARALLARSLIGITSVRSTLYRDRDGIGTTKWQLGAKLDAWLVETSKRTPHFHVTSIKCVIKYD